MKKNIYLFVIFISSIFFLNIIIPSPINISATTVKISENESNDMQLESTGENPPLGYEYIFGGHEIAVLGYLDPYGYKNAVKISEGDGSTYKNWETYSDKNYNSVELCDLDGDHKDDLVLLEADTTGIKIKIVGSINSNTIAISGDYYPRDIACGDFNMDLENEIAVLIGDWFDGKKLMILDKHGNILANNLKISGNFDNDGWKQIVSGDVDGDLVDEVVALSKDLDPHSNRICIRHETLIEEDDNPVADNYLRFTTDEKVKSIACGDLKSDLDGKDEIILYGHKGDNFNDFKIVDDQGQTIKGWSDIPSGQYGGYASAGDFDSDGDDEMVIVTEYGTINIFEPGGMDDNPFSTKSFDITNNYKISAVSCGDVDKDGIKLEYTGSKRTFDSDEYYPIALLYHPACLEGYNSGDYKFTYSAYGYQHTSVKDEQNIVGIGAETVISGSPKLFGYFKINLKAKFKNYMEERKGYGTTKSVSTTYITGSRPEPYVYCEKTTYDVYEYRIVNGPKAGEIFTIDIPAGITTTEKCLSRYNSERINAPEIISEHITGDPTSYTILNREGFYDNIIENHWARTADGPHEGKITLGTYQSKTFTDSKEVSYTMGLNLFLGLDCTTTLKSGKSHVIAVGDLTTFEYRLDELDPKHQKDWGYEYKMYLRRNPDYNYVIIDFLVNPDTLGDGYKDNDAPIVEIQSPKAGYLYLSGRELIPLFNSKYDCIVINPLDMEIYAIDEHSGIDKVNVLFDGIEHPAQIRSENIWTFPIINNNYYLPESHTYRAKAYDEEGRASETDEMKICSIMGNSPPFLYGEINGPDSGKSGQNYSCSFQLFDLEGDDIYYKINWGDESNAEWVGPIENNMFPEDDDPLKNLITIDESHEWKRRGSYNITIEVKDSNENIGVYTLSKDVNIGRKRVRNHFLNLEKLIGLRMPIINLLLKLLKDILY